MYNTYNGKAYRFLSFDGLHKTIETEKLRLTHPSQFNDPIDNSSYLSPLTWKEWNNLNLAKLAEDRYSKLMFRSIYIASFSKEYKSENSYLMWSHYANSHKGVCFEIDFSKIKFLGNPDEVIYPESIVDKRNNLILKNSNQISLGIDNQDEIGLFLVTNKHKVWEYEKEIRLIVDTGLIKNSKNFKKSHDEKYLFVKFDLNYISKVIFAINSDKENEIIIINMLKEKGVFPKYEKMRINPESLTLESEKYP